MEVKELESKVLSIAKKYAEVVEKRIDTIATEKVVTAETMEQINDGIRMIGHITTTLERCVRIHSGKADTDR